VTSSLQANNQYRGEKGIGNWTIIVKDTNVNRFTGVFVDWHLKLWGESRDPSKAKLLPMPTEEDDNDHAVIATTTLPATTTILPTSNPASTDSGVAVVPSDHPTRPVNSKPTESQSIGFDDQQQQQEEEETAPPQPSQSAPPKSNWLPSFLPTFGVSAATQLWIYGSLVLILLFCSGLGIYLWLARRRRLRNNPRNNYEFELLDEDEVEGLAAAGGPNSEKRGGAGAGGLVAGREGRVGGRKKTRGGELYDAFAGGSDDELDDLDSEDDFGGRDDNVVSVYRDQPSASGSGSASDDGSPIRLSEKLPGHRLGSDEDEHHVVGDDEDDDDDDVAGDHAARPLR
jgi:kexin